MTPAHLDSQPDHIIIIIRYVHLAAQGRDVNGEAGSSRRAHPP
jgi:hypothetical protein